MTTLTLPQLPIIMAFKPNSLIQCHRNSLNWAIRELSRFAIGRPVAASLSSYSRLKQL